MPKLVLVSDTHGQHRRLEVPDGDVFIHAGDFTTFSGDIEDVIDFNEYLGTLPHRHKLVVAGNHDFGFEREPARARALLTNATYLEDSSIEVAGVRFFGSPWTPEFMNWAFNLPRGRALREKWRAIPDNTKVLITHGPPFGILDMTSSGQRVGCEELLARVRELNPAVHVFGHIHEARGIAHRGATTFINASTAFRSWEPYVIEV